MDTEDSLVAGRLRELFCDVLSGVPRWAGLQEAVSVLSGLRPALKGEVR